MGATFTILYKFTPLFTNSAFLSFLSRYTSKMLLAAIDENHQGTYDFLYLPIDFKVILVIGIIQKFASLLTYLVKLLLLVMLMIAFTAEQMQCWLCLYQYGFSLPHHFFL